MRSAAGQSPVSPDAVEEQLVALRKARPAASVESLMKAAGLSGTVPEG